MQQFYLQHRITPLPSVLLVLWVSVVFLLSSQPQPFIAIDEWLGLQGFFVDLFEIIRKIDGYDKYLHAFIWLLLGLLLWLASMRLSFRSLAQRIWFVFVMAVLLGSIDECHQYFVPYRTSSIADLLADACGVMIMLLIVTSVDRYYRHERTEVVE